MQIDDCVCESFDGGINYSVSLAYVYGRSQKKYDCMVKAVFLSPMFITSDDVMCLHFNRRCEL